MVFPRDIFIKYNPSEESDDQDPENVFPHSFQLLKLWSAIPNHRPSGSIRSNVGMSPLPDERDKTVTDMPGILPVALKLPAQHRFFPLYPGHEKHGQGKTDKHPIS